MKHFGFHDTELALDVGNGLVNIPASTRPEWGLEGACMRAGLFLRKTQVARDDGAALMLRIKLARLHKITEPRCLLGQNFTSLHKTTKTALYKGRMI